jgi:tRNA-dihydrouridine synthase 1
MYQDASSKKKAKFQKPSSLELASEYMKLVETYPVSVKCCIFHLRRMCKREFEKYQLLEDCMLASSLETLKTVVSQALEYESSGNFVPDKNKTLKAKEIMERKKREEGKRKQYEERMIRKAKREGKSLDFFLKVGIAVPTFEELTHLKGLSKSENFELWKKQFGQHCYSYHFDGSCARERSCAFLHIDATRENVEAPIYG